MATQKEVGVGDFVLLDTIDIESFMRNLKLRWVQFLKNSTLKYKLERNVFLIKRRVCLTGVNLNTKKLCIMLHNFLIIN